MATFTGTAGTNTFTGTASADTFNFASGTAQASDVVNGGGGADTLVFTTFGGTIDFSAVSLSAIQTLGAQGGNETVAISAAQYAAFSTINLGSGTDTLNVNASGTLDISAGIAPLTSGTETINLVGSGGADTVTLSSAQFLKFATIDLGVGSDVLNVRVSGTTSLTGATTAAANIEAVNLIGSAGADTVTITGAEFIALNSIDLAGGTDSLTVNVGGTADLSAGRAPTTANTEAVTLAGSTGDDTVTLSAAQFSRFTAINLSSGTDALNVTLTGSVDISGGPAATLTGVESRSLIGSAGDEFDHAYRRPAEPVHHVHQPRQRDRHAGLDVDLDRPERPVERGIARCADHLGGYRRGRRDHRLANQTEAFTILGSSSGDSLTAGSGNDILTGGGGNDTINGGGGTGDTVVFSGAWTDYVISQAGGSYTVTDARAGSPDGTDTVSNVENFQFSNGTFTAAQILNEAPTDIALSAATAAENAPNGTIVGALSRTDPDAALGDTASFSLINNAGGRFAVSGGNLVVANGGLLDFETSTSHSVTVRITDARGLTYDESFTVNRHQRQRGAGHQLEWRWRDGVGQPRRKRHGGDHRLGERSRRRRGAELRHRRRRRPGQVHHQRLGRPFLPGGARFRGAGRCRRQQRL